MVPVPAGLLDDPGGHLLCAGVALVLLALAGWRRPPVLVRMGLACLGGTVGLTSPWLAHLDRHWLGAFPTIDKEGSLLFYLDGVHRRSLADPVAAMADPAVQLIGVHTGHLWLVEAADLVLGPVGAFGLWALLSPALAWWLAALLARAGGVRPLVALSLGFPFGMGLHVFRDLNWYTIEKAQVFWLPLFGLVWWRARERGGRALLGPALLWPVLAWNNLYLGILVAIGAAAWVALDLLRAPRSAPHRRALGAGLLAALVGAPVVLWQHLLMAGAPPLAPPAAFLWQRAALDSVELWPPAWNRLELWRALNPVALGLGLAGLWRLRRQPLAQSLVGVGLLLGALALGPALVHGAPGAPAVVANPVYMAFHAVVPGFWRIAKPETFFHGCWLLLLLAGAQTAEGWLPRDRRQWLLPLLVVAAWLALVRTHPAFPGLSAPVESALAPDWQHQRR